jgi:large subunit ribosomal protein L6
MLGTDYRHVSNLVKGLVNPFETVLEIHGLGYRVKQQGSQLVLTLGKSHDDIVDIPSDVSVAVPNEREIVCKSHSKKKLGDFVSAVCFKRKPKAYKAKGVRVRGRHYHTKGD